MPMCLLLCCVSFLCLQASTSSKPPPPCQCHIHRTLPGADTLNTQMVSMHNFYRLRHMGMSTTTASGLQAPASAAFAPAGAGLGLLPYVDAGAGAPGRRLLELTPANVSVTYNSSLAAAAAAYASKCIWGHNASELTARNEGENL